MRRSARWPSGPAGRRTTRGDSARPSTAGRVFAEEAGHFPRGVGAGGVGVRALPGAAGPGVAGPVDDPPLDDGPPARVVVDGPGEGPAAGRPPLRDPHPAAGVAAAT